MAWWGKLVGGAFGFVLGGPLGALLGAALGHQFDRGLGQIGGLEGLPPGNRERVQTAFFTATFSVLGHVAKADGRVSRSEIQMAEQVMRHMALRGDQRRAAIALFNEGKQAGFALEAVLRQFGRECRQRTNLLRIFLEIQIQAALADGRVDGAEQRMLERIAGALGFSTHELRHLLHMLGAQAGGGAGAPRMDLDAAYEILGVDAGASAADVKKAYRRLMSQHHPDKLVAKGLPEEMMQIATEKTQKIRAAYELITQARGG